MGNLKRSDRDSRQTNCCARYAIWNCYFQTQFPHIWQHLRNSHQATSPQKCHTSMLAIFSAPPPKLVFRAGGWRTMPGTVQWKCANMTGCTESMYYTYMYIYIYMYICNTTARQLETRHCKAGVPAQLNHSTAATEEATSTGATSHCGRNCVRPRNAAAQHSVAQVRCGCDEQMVNRCMLYTPTTQAGRSGKASAWVGG